MADITTDEEYLAVKQEAARLHQALRAVRTQPAHGEHRLVVAKQVELMKARLGTTLNKMHRYEKKESQCTPSPTPSPASTPTPETPDETTRAAGVSRPWQRDP